VGKSQIGHNEKASSAPAIGLPNPGLLAPQISNPNSGIPISKAEQALPFDSKVNLSLKDRLREPWFLAPLQE
jgi:hypothetical protein